MLRVRTGPKALRAVGGSFFKLWESGKINRPEHTAGGSQNKGTEKLQRRAAPSPLEEGGRGDGKGANSVPERPPPPTRRTGPRFRSKDFLKPDLPRAGAAKGKGALHPGRERPSLWLPESLAALGRGAPHPGKVHPGLWLPEPRREKARRIQGEGAQASGCLSPQAGEGTKCRRNRIRAFVEDPKTGTALSAGRSIQSSREPEQCRRGKHRHPSTGQTQCGRNTGSAPDIHRHLPAAPRPPRSRTDLI